MVETREPHFRSISVEALIKQLKALGAKEHQMFTPASNPTAGSKSELISIGSSFFVGENQEDPLPYIFLRTNPAVSTKTAIDFLNTAFPADWPPEAPAAALIRISPHPQRQRLQVEKCVISLEDLTEILNSSPTKSDLAQAINKQLI